jgi:hypothetical protein
VELWERIKPLGVCRSADKTQSLTWSTNHNKLISSMFYIFLMSRAQDTWPTI